MSTKRILAGLAVCIWVAGLASGAAQARDEFDSPGIYLGGGIAGGWDNFDSISFSSAGTAVGFDAWLGWRILPFLAAELELDYLNGFETPRADSTVGFTGNVKGILPLGRFQPFALVGVGLLSLQPSTSISALSSSTDFAARFGGGIDIYILKWLAIQAKVTYVLGTGSVDGFDYVSLVGGANFAF